MKRYLPLLGLFLCMGISMGAGLFYYRKYIHPKITEVKKPLYFSLIDTDNNLIVFNEQSPGSTSKIFYLPDNLNFETQQKLMEIVKKTKRSKNHKVLFVSRLDLDTARNLKRISGFSGKILLDPSASLWNRIHHIQPQKNEPKWTSLLLDSKNNIVKLDFSASPVWLE